MSLFWDWVTGRDVTPNATVESPDSVGPTARPGDPDGVVFEGEETFSGERAAIWPSPWDGWPAEWNVPNWDSARLDGLVDAAWACVDLNASVLAAMPVYRLRSGEVIEPLSWMLNPDPGIYTSWFEFAHELFWDYQMGEAFVLTMERYANGFPSKFRVIPPWSVNAEMTATGTRSYKIGVVDVTGDILHIRNKSSTGDARGHGPLEVGRTRLVAAALLGRYVTELARGGGIPYYVIEVPHRLSPTDAQQILDHWWESRTKRLGQPAIVTHGGRARQVQMSPADIGLTDIAQFNESRIAVLLGVPPFLVGLPSGGDSMCVDTDTEILTRNGWRRYDELVIGAEVLTLNHETGVGEWQPLLDVSVFDVVDRDMVSIEMLGHSSFSTDDHQWPVVFRSAKTGEARRMLRLSRDLKRTDALVTAAPCADQPAEPKHLDSVVELVAWWFTEGYAGAGDTALIAQSETVNPEHCARIRAALCSLFGSSTVGRQVGPAWSEYSAGNGMRAFRLNRAASEIIWAAVENRTRKVVDRRFLYELTPAQLELFIQVSVWADGCESNGQITFKQFDPDRLERFELACVLAGKSTMRHRGDEVTVRRRAAPRPVEADRRSRRMGGEPIVRALTWSGRVWCPTTPNETWFARRNGTAYFTHNTYSNVSSLFDYHDRASLRPKATAVMAALSNWVLPRGQAVELNRDEYSRPAFNERAEAWVKLVDADIVKREEVRAMERFRTAPTSTTVEDDDPLLAALQLTGDES